jgi:DNA-binding transcriptional LysR family regulator
MEVKHLRTFVAAASENSFTRAAESLNITQAAVSQHVAALEQELATPLFDRTGRTVSLTEAGHRMNDYAQRIIALVEEAHEAVAGIETHIEGRIRIAASTIPAEHLLPRMLAEFREQFPDVREAVHITDSRLATKAVLAGDADIGLVGEEPKSSRVVVVPVATDELILVVSTNHEHVGKRYITPQSLLKQKLIMREPGSGSRQCVEESLREQRISLDQLNVVMEVNSNDAIRAAVREDIGIAFLSSLSAASDLESGELQRVDVRGVQPTRKLFLIHKPEGLYCPATRAFVDFVIDRCESSCAT